MEFLTSILENIDEALIISDAAGKVLFFNEVALNLSKEIFDSPLRTQDNIIQILKTKDEVIQDFLGDPLSKKKSFIEYPTHQGTILYLELNYIPIKNSEQGLTHIHIFIRDITPQKIFEKRFTDQAVNISNLIDRANAIIIGVDTRGYITEWNQYCASITGFAKEDVFARKFSEVLSLGHKDKFDKVLEQILAKESVSNYEITVRVKSNEKAIFLLNGTHRFSPTEAVTGVLFVGQDVTELTSYRMSLEKKVEERTLELQQAIKKEKEVLEMKSRFISIASHEFRTPLSSIEYAAGYLKANSGLFVSMEIIKKIENIEKQVKHMMSLLDDVLTYGKSEAGKIQLIYSDVQLQDFIFKITDDVRQSTKRTHTIETNLQDLPAEIKTDEKLFRNIFTNLLSNAIKFSPGCDKVYLDVVRNNDQLEIDVRDDGIGIPADEVDRIFEPFIRGKGVGTIQGTGLGLSIVKKAVELLHGNIKASSASGSGTTFSIKIPIDGKD